MRISTKALWSVLILYTKTNITYLEEGLLEYPSYRTILERVALGPASSAGRVNPSEARLRRTERDITDLHKLVFIKDGDHVASSYKLTKIRSLMNILRTVFDISLVGGHLLKLRYNQP